MKINVFLAGEATDDPESVIVQAARRLDEGRFPLSQVGIQFIQIGNDAAAAEALQELDDGLAETHKIRVSDCHENLFAGSPDPICVLFYLGHG